MEDVTIHDLAACGDVFDWLYENADSLSAEKAIEMLEAAQQLHGRLRSAIHMLETQALKSIEQPILIGRVAYSKKPSIKKRPEQNKIAARVCDLASQPDMDTGEVGTTYDAAVAAVEMMRALYVSPSTQPKVGGVRNIGYKMDDVTTEERTGWELKRIEIE